MPEYKLKQLRKWFNLCPIASSPGAFLSAEAQPAVSWFLLLLWVLAAFASAWAGSGCKWPQCGFFSADHLQDICWMLLTLLSSGQVTAVFPPCCMESSSFSYLWRCFTICIYTHDVSSELLCKPPTNHPGVKKPNHKDYKEIWKGRLKLRNRRCIVIFPVSLLLLELINNLCLQLLGVIYFKKCKERAFRINI